MASGVDNKLLVKNDELLTLDALLAEVDTELKSVAPQFSGKSLRKIDVDNVENFLLLKFNEYSGHVDEPFSTANDGFAKDINEKKELKSPTKILNGKETLEDKREITNRCKYMEASLKSNEHSYVYIDPIFGLRILGPQISSALLIERMAGRKIVTFNELSKQIDLKTASDWVIAAVLISKEVKCSSKNLSRFTIWRLSDLQGNMKTISVLLFQNAHNELWKTAPACSSTSGQISTKKLLYKDRLILDSLSNTKITENKITNECTLKSNVSSVPQKYKNDGIATKVEADEKQRKTDLERVKSLYITPNFSNIFSQNQSRIEFKGTDTHQKAKDKAFEVLKRCPIEKVNPNSIRGTVGGKKRVLDVLNGSENSKRRKIEENHDMHISDIFETGSNHRDLVNVRQKQEEEKYFIRLEKKEAMEEKMLKTFSISCKAVICKDCKYTAFSAADRCKNEKHSFKIIDAVKRFFQCKDCGNRTITLFKLPKFSCSNCKGSRWERSAMVRDRKLNDLPIPFSIRGDEEKFLGTTNSKLNVNLLMPQY
ncbi:protein MCM10 homolog isoform X2 [Bactrocera dorsalis]|uniref:Protein MCM10 homolog isoform X2 n=1 Tax=Bactrocera dorsalis TaxID=27457 RepID=A0ABM3KAJ9_BACDO|nr:protein MCM10 homolog isoform X2 [Bactrocera dorsalis]